MEVSIMLLCTQPTLIDVVRGIPFQDAAKAGLLFGDEGEPEKRTFHCKEFTHMVLVDLGAEEEKETQAEIKEKFKPLLGWLKTQAGGIVRDSSYRVDLSFSCL